MERPSPLRRPYRVFISSTSLDLQAHRAVVNDTIVRLQQYADDMARFGARPGSAIAESVAAVDDADIYLGIFAWRYGTIKPGQEHSITHLEYDEAVRRDMPRLIFLADPSTEALDGPTQLFPATARDPEHDAPRRDLRRLLEAEQVVDTFTTPEDLGRRAAIALFLQILHEVPERLRVPRDVPPRTSGFVGRADELAQLDAALRQGQSVGLSAAVAGMGGVGKSALAAEAIARIVPDPQAFPGGITWVRCDGRVGQEGQVWVYDQILTRWQRPLGPQEVATATTVAAQIDQREQALRSRMALPGAALVLLDNVETALPLSDMLDLFATLAITVLVTSRTSPASPRLRIYALEVLTPEAAVDLFAERYRARGGDWQAERDRLTTLAVVETLGWLPLAIELAAARAARIQKSVLGLAQELREPDVLGKLRDPTDTRASVRYALEKSLEVLTPAQVARFATLGLPEGSDWPQPVILALFAAVPPDAPADSTGAADDLELLVALSLATLATAEAEAGTGAAPLRMRLHPLVRALAQERWRQQPAATRSAALAGLLAGIAILTDANQHDFIHLALEEPLTVAAVRQAAQSQIADQEVMQTIYALNNYLTTGGHWRLGVELTQLQLAIARQSEDQDGEAYALSMLGVLVASLGKRHEAVQYSEQALVIQRTIRDRHGEGQTLSNLGTLAADLGKLDEATQYGEQALAIRRDIGDREGEGRTLMNLGTLVRDLGRSDEAMQYFEQALTIQRTIGDRRWEALTLSNLGALVNDLGKVEEAAQYYEQALVIQREIGDRQGEGRTLMYSGTLARDVGKSEEAMRYYEQALMILKDIGDQHFEEATLANLGILASDKGRTEEAAQYYGQALAIQREIGDRQGEGETLMNMGYLARSLGKTEEAVQYYEQALRIFVGIGVTKEAQDVRDRLAALQVQDELPVGEVVVEEQAAVQQSAESSVPVVEEAPRRWRWPWQR